MTSKSLRIGLLECDHVDDQFRGATGGDYPHLFRQWLVPHTDDLELIAYDVVHGDLPAGPDECDGWLCTGSRASVTDGETWIHDAQQFVANVVDAGRPYLGVCFGHQLLAQALGGRVDRAVGGWGAGVRRIDIVAPQPWMRPDSATLDLHFMHQDQVVDLPPDATLVGSADHCPHAMFTAGSAFGVQAHPEFVPEYTEALLRARSLRIGAATTDAALATLRQPTDEALIGRWAVQFWTT